LARLAAELLDVGPGGIRPQDGVVNQRRDIQRRRGGGRGGGLAPGGQQFPERIGYS